MGDDAKDPLLENAQQDFDALAKRLGEELHAADDHVSAKQKFFELVTHYAPAVVEAAVRVALSLAGVPVPPPLPPTT